METTTMVLVRLKNKILKQDVDGTITVDIDTLRNLIDDMKDEQIDEIVIDQENVSQYAEDGSELRVSYFRRKETQEKVDREIAKTEIAQLKHLHKKYPNIKL